MPAKRMAMASKSQKSLARSTPTGPRPLASHVPLGTAGFVVLMAALMALNATAIDIMLPALPQMADAMGLVAANSEQLVITAYLGGFGIGQFFIGALTDRFGRRPVLLAGLAIYAMGGVLSALAPDYALLLAARAAQGAGAAAPRIIVTAVIRDCYTGAQMAKVTSFAMMAFMAAPVFAPSIGQAIMLAGSWRWIFGFLSLYALVVLIACAARLPETLPHGWRRGLGLGDLGRSIVMVLSKRQTMGYALASGLFFGALFGFIASAQPILAELYGLGEWFPVVFGGVALFIALAAFINAMLVGRLGMRALSHGAVLLFTTVSTALAIVASFGPVPFWMFLVLIATAMMLVGLVFANFNALAMEPQGQVAGIASSIIGGTTTLIGATGGYLIGQAYDGTVLPLTAGYALCGAATLLVLLITERGRLFQLGPSSAA
jgi:DHA1 family bicyclomycin/chloramphenicol resistance-like MFS transporter